MKKLSLVILLSLWVHLVQAQTKQEKAIKKEWEKKKKKISPEDFKALLATKESSEQALKLAENSLEESKTTLDQKSTEVTDLRTRQTELDQLKKIAIEEQNNKPAIGSTEESGTLYKVQIFSCNGEGNKDEETARRYTLGRFASLTQARQFEKSLLKMQISSKIIAYKDGKPVK